MRYRYICKSFSPNILALLNLINKMVQMLLQFSSVIRRNPLRRFGIAFCLSILMHVLIVWMPSIHLPLAKVQLPPLSVRLEALPERDDASDAINQAEDKRESAKRVDSPGKKSSSKMLDKMPSAMKKLEKSDVPQLFPKHLHLAFTVFKGAGSKRSGEAEHRLDLQGNRYTLQSIKRTARISGLPGQEQFIQTSLGVLGEHGIYPETYQEEIFTAGKRQVAKAKFDRVAQGVNFSREEDAPLPDGAQDALSFMYQLSQLSLKKEIIPLSVVNTTAVEEYNFEIGRKEEIETPSGKVRTVHLRKLHKHGDPYMEIWLGLEYRLLPMKLRWIDGADEVIEEQIIHDIRASDE